MPNGERVASYLKKYADAKVVIKGYASPEGSLAGNKRLSEGRALALKNYLARRYSFAPSLYHIVFGGENWEGLRKALTDLDVVYKAEIELIIDNYDGQKRKERLMKFQGGEPYRYLLRNIYSVSNQYNKWMKKFLCRLFPSAPDQNKLRRSNIYSA